MFVALLYTSYEFIANDYVMELSWLHNLSNFIKPYEISIAFENQKKLNEVYQDLHKEKKQIETRRRTRCWPTIDAY